MIQDEWRLAFRFASARASAACIWLAAFGSRVSSRVRYRRHFRIHCRLRHPHAPNQFVLLCCDIPSHTTNRFMHRISDQINLLPRWHALESERQFVRLRREGGRHFARVGLGIVCSATTLHNISDWHRACPHLASAPYEMDGSAQVLVCSQSSSVSQVRTVAAASHHVATRTLAGWLLLGLPAGEREDDKCQKGCRSEMDEWRDERRGMVADVFSSLGSGSVLSCRGP